SRPARAGLSSASGIAFAGLEISRIEIALEQNHRRKPVDGLGALFDPDTALPQDARSFHSGEPLVPELDIEAQVAGQMLAELSSPFRLPAGVAAHVQRVADHDP